MKGNFVTQSLPSGVILNFFFRKKLIMGLVDTTEGFNRFILNAN